MILLSTEIAEEVRTPGGELAGAGCAVRVLQRQHHVALDPPELRSQHQSQPRGKFIVREALQLYVN